MKLADLKDLADRKMKKLISEISPKSEARGVNMTTSMPVGFVGESS